MTMTANGLAKLLEECGELSQVAAKKLAYFHTNEHPDGAGALDNRMQDEIADVIAACLFVADKFKLDVEAICDRRDRKLALFDQWHADRTNGAEAFHTVAPLEHEYDTPEWWARVAAHDKAKHGIG